jgi:hypothetical protein
MKQSKQTYTQPREVKVPPYVRDNVEAYARPDTMPPTPGRTKKRGTGAMRQSLTFGKNG